MAKLISPTLNECIKAIKESQKDINDNLPKADLQTIAIFKYRLICLSRIECFLTELEKSRILFGGNL